MLFEDKACLCDAVLHVESNGGIFMFVSGLQRPKITVQIAACNFRRFVNHLGITNRRTNFIFDIGVVETSLHEGCRMILHLCPYDHPIIPRLFPGYSFVFSFDTPTRGFDFPLMLLICLQDSPFYALMIPL